MIKREIPGVSTGYDLYLKSWQEAVEDAPTLYLSSSIKIYMLIMLNCVIDV